MTKKNIEVQAQDRLNNLSEEEIESMANKRKKIISDKLMKILALPIALSLLGLTFLVIGIICINEDGLSLLYCGLVFLIPGIIGLITITVLKIKLRGQDIKKIALKQLIKIIKEEERIQQEIIDSKQIDGRYIKHVKIIDSYTMVTDKLHPFLNFQEVIQHRYYKFQVVFEDESSKIYEEEEGSTNYNKLIKWVGKDLPQESGQKSETAADEIRKFKALLDEGIISIEEFEKKKHDLLEK